MERIDEVIKKQQTNPYGIVDNAKVQRSFYVPKWIWDAAEGLPGGRPQAIIRALLNDITAFKSEIPQLRYDVEQIDLQIETLLAQKTAKLNRIAELENEETEDIKQVAIKEFTAKQAVLETVALLDMFRKDLGHGHYKRLEELSGTAADDIKTFLTEKKFRPSEEEIRLFYMR